MLPEQGYIDRAKAFFEQQLKINQDDPDVVGDLYNLYSQFHLIIDDVPTGISFTKKAIVAKDDYKNNLNLGELLFFNSELTEAKQQLHATLEMDDKPAEALFFLSLVEDSLGNKYNRDQFLNSAPEQ